MLEITTLRLQHFRKHLHEVSCINSAVALLEWDKLTGLSTLASGGRNEAISSLTSLAHDKFTDPVVGKLIGLLYPVKDSLTPQERCIVVRTKEDYEEEIKLPTYFVAEESEAHSAGYDMWVEARKKSDFSIFGPQLEKIVGYARKRADFLGYTDSPYDALLSQYEPDLTTSKTTAMLLDLKDFLIPLLEKIKRSHVKIPREILNSNCPIDQQKEFVRFLADYIGFDLEAGKIDVTEHPMCNRMGPYDTRLSLRYKESDLLNEAVFGILHEAGHGIYEQGLDQAMWDTPMGTPVSMGFHESQSRLWENLVGRSWPFWVVVANHLRAKFPEQYQDVVNIDLYRAINMVHPGCIRVDADEVTYNLHIILRFELERDLIEGKIKVSDLPALWNQKMKEYLGVDVPDDAHGVLQDVHWSDGSFGYFPTYSLGNIYSAQIFEAAVSAIPSLRIAIKQSECRQLRQWLNENIHIHGRMYDSAELMVRVTGKPPSADSFKQYLGRKYGQLYQF